MFDFLRKDVVLDTDDAGLRRLTHERLKVFTKFTADNCPVCEMLGPSFARFADDEAYEGILFLRLDADQSPVARQLMNERAAPFFVSYCQGRVVECDTRHTEADVEAQLARLRALMPHTA
ncbi:thioredoxin family protein [Hymenobacter sp. B1770]|uniref:thioredoxin family protein n=1 Tax=Hymenobacter sp. B1770 TaxID=1718788 RepID=UPI003CF4B1C8